jgi:hypothetical protein
MEEFGCKGTILLIYIKTINVMFYFRFVFSLKYFTAVIALGVPR